MKCKLDFTYLNMRVKELQVLFQSRNDAETNCFNNHDMYESALRVGFSGMTFIIDVDRHLSDVHDGYDCTVEHFFKSDRENYDEQTTDGYKLFKKTN